MNNIEMSTEGNTLILRVDLTQDLGASKSGKTRIIGTSNGNVRVPGHEEIRVGLNVFKSVSEA